MRNLLLLLALSPAIAHDFNLFLSISCDPACEIIIRHAEVEEFYMSGSRPNQIGRHSDVPVPFVDFKIDYLRNLTDFETITYDFRWVSHENKTLHFKREGVSIIGHYFCPEDRCHTDYTRLDYRKQVNRWCFGLIFSGIFFFMLLSGAGEALYKFLKRGLRPKRKPSSQKTPMNYDQLVMKEGDVPRIY